MSDGTYRRLASSLLVAHQRRDLGSCVCGWSELSKSHADHVAAILDAAGVLRDRPPPTVEEDTTQALPKHLQMNPRKVGEILINLARENDELRGQVDDLTSGELATLLQHVDGFLGLIVHRGDVDHEGARDLLDRVKVHTRR